MTNSEEVDQNVSKYKSPLHWFITLRRSMRSRVNSIEPIDRILHLYSSIVLLLNIFFILYAMISLTSRMMLNGVPFIDSLPLAFYILPLLIFLPKLLLDYYRSRSAIFTIVIFLIVAVVFGMISTLVRGFTILVVLNIASIVIVFVLGRFRPTAPLKSIGRKGVAWFLILNSLGLMLPASIYVMGQFPISTASYSESTTIFIEMPLSSFEYNFVNITPDSSLLSDLQTTGFGVDLRYNAFDSHSITLLNTWILALSGFNIPYRVTSSGTKDNFLQSDPELLGNTELLALQYGHHWSAILQTLEIFDDLSISTENLSMSLDMTLSLSEWNLLMNQTRSVNLQGFSDLVKKSLDAIDSTFFPSMAFHISQLIEERGISVDLLVEGFVVDDFIDGDVTMMELCGISPEVVALLNSEFEVLCDRSRYSEGMAGDVGEYLVHTYSLSSLARSLRIGIAGIETGLEDVRAPVYPTLEELASDIAIASGNGVEEIIVASLPSILSSFGDTGLILLNDAIQSQETVEITYTFRIFAFRAVVMAIDSFDFLMY